MENLSYILFICIVLPLILSSFLLKGNERRIIIFIIIGSCCCLFVSELNGLLLSSFSYDKYYVTTTITPITEEIVKTLPILFFGIVISSDKKTLIQNSIALGIGFALLENLIILVGNIDGVSFLWAISRVFGAALMHGVCTAAVGYGISFVLKKRKLFIVGTFSLLVATIIYHALFNVLVQSDLKYLGIAMPILTYIPIIIILFSKKLQGKKSHKEINDSFVNSMEVSNGNKEV